MTALKAKRISDSKQEFVEILNRIYKEIEYDANLGKYECGEICIKTQEQKDFVTTILAENGFKIMDAEDFNIKISW